MFGGENETCQNRLSVRYRQNTQGRWPSGSGAPESISAGGWGRWFGNHEPICSLKEESEITQGKGQHGLGNNGAVPQGHPDVVRELAELEPLYKARR